MGVWNHCPLSGSVPKILVENVRKKASDQSDYAILHLAESRWRNTSIRIGQKASESRNHDKHSIVPCPRNTVSWHGKGIASRPLSRPLLSILWTPVDIPWTPVSDWYEDGERDDGSQRFLLFTVVAIKNILQSFLFLQVKRFPMSSQFDLRTSVPTSCTLLRSHYRRQFGQLQGPAQQKSSDGFFLALKSKEGVLRSFTPVLLHIVEDSIILNHASIISVSLSYH